MPNVFGLPHVGSAIMATRIAMARALADEIAAVLADERPVQRRHAAGAVKAPASPAAPPAAA